MGFAIIRPMAGICGNAAAAGYPSLTVSEKDFSGTTIDVGALNVNSVDSNSPYVASGANMPSGMKARVVACGITISYVGDANVKGGTVLMAQDPSHSTLVGKSYADLAPEPWTKTDPVIGHVSHQVTWTPARDSELSYEGKINSADYGGAPCMAIIVEAPQGRLFYVEAVFHYEWLGFSASRLTPNVADPVGFSGVLTVANSTAAHSHGVSFPRSGKEGPANRIHGFLSGATKVVTHGLSGASKALSAVAPAIKPAWNATEKYLKKHAYKLAEQLMAGGEAFAPLAPLLLAAA